MQLPCKMADVIKDNIHFIILVQDTKTSRKQQEMLISTISNSQLKALSEIAYNTLKGSIDLEADEKRRLKRYAQALRTLGDKKASIASRRETLSVPLINTLLPAVLQYITTLISD